MKYQRSFRQLTVWQKAKELTISLYSDTAKFPKQETYGLSSQLQRASSSIMANIAEGNNRRSTKEKLRFFNIALASLTEVDCLLELSSELNYVANEIYKKRVEQINKTAFLLKKLSMSITTSQSSQKSQ